MQRAVRSIRRWLPALVVMAAIFWFSSMPADEVVRTTGPVLEHAPKTVKVGVRIPVRWLKVGHVVGYALLGAALLHAVRPVGRWAPGLALLLALGHAVADEFHQTFRPGRSASLQDVLLDVAAAGAAIVVWMVTAWILNHRRKTNSSRVLREEAL
jgi:VanZ family protein